MSTLVGRRRRLVVLWRTCYLSPEAGVSGGPCQLPCLFTCSEPHRTDNHTPQACCSYVFFYSTQDKQNVCSLSGLILQRCNSSVPVLPDIHHPKYVGQARPVQSRRQGDAVPLETTDQCIRGSTHYIKKCFHNKPINFSDNSVVFISLQVSEP